MKTKLLILLIFIFGLVGCEDKNKDPNTFKFETSFINDGHNLPIIYVKLGSKKTNLVVDTGSDANIISNSYYLKNKKDFELIDSTSFILSTLHGEERVKSYIVKAFINDSIEVKFKTMNMNSMISNIQNNQGIVVRGMLGVEFLYQNKSIVDFNEEKITNHFKMNN